MEIVLDSDVYEANGNDFGWWCDIKHMGNGFV